MKSLILLHGALGAASQFNELEELLKGRFDVHKFDFEGHGSRPLTRTPTMDHFTENLLEYMDEHKLIQPQIFGYSMGGYVALNTSIKHPGVLGEYITLGSKLKWKPEIAAAEIRKINAEKIEEKVPEFAHYLNELHYDWKENMHNTAILMDSLGQGAALTLEDFAKVNDTVHMRLGDLDNMVSREETEEVANVIINANFALLENTQHPLHTMDPAMLANLISSLL